MGILAVVATGCASQMVTIVPKPPVNAQKLGRVEGSAAGALGIGGTAYYFIPMGLNGRVQRAYDAALAKAPGATGLTNVTLEDDWYWIVIGTLRHTTITGEAVK
jgi:hypothetical protein